MKKIILSVLVVGLAVSFVLGDACTVRIFTGQKGWKIERIRPHRSEIQEADTVCKLCCVEYWVLENPWDDITSDGDWNCLMGPIPVPWHMLYIKNEARWNSFHYSGADAYCPRPSDTSTWVYYRYFSPTFRIRDGISRATIWASVDDKIIKVTLRNIGTGDTISLLSGEVVGFVQLARWDVTDIFRGCSAGDYQIELIVVNTTDYFTGLMFYMSYDYADTPYEYVYDLQTTIRNEWKCVSMPFYPSTAGMTTLAQILLGIDSAKFYEPRTGTWRYLDISKNLKGAFGDTVRTYSFWIRYGETGSHTRVISGYPIFEQLYLDMPDNNLLWFGTVNCKVPFAPPDTFPQDYPNGKILASRTLQYAHADHGGESTTTDTVRARWAYRSTPRNFLNSLPYHLAISCDCGLVGELLTDESNEPVYFELSGEELRRMIEASVSGSAGMDSSEVFARIEMLRRNDLLECDGGTFPEIPKAFDFDSRISFPKISVSAFPSPFNDKLTIIVDIPEEDIIMLCIYDIEGRLVRTLSYEKLPIGKYRFVWDATSSDGKPASSGLYFVNLKSSTGSLREKVMLVR